MRKLFTAWCRVSCFSVGVSALLLAAPIAGAIEVKLEVIEGEGIARCPAVITMGVPFAKGVVKDVAKLAVKAADQSVPAQFLPTVLWDDGSVRWALMDVQCQVPASGRVGLTISDGGGNPIPPAPVKVEDSDDSVTLSTGPLQYTLHKREFNLFESLRVDGKELVTAAGKGLVIYREGGGEVAAGAPTSVEIEQAGPLRTLVRARGRFPGLHKGLLGYTVRISAFAGQKFLKVQVWLENDGALGYNFRPNYDGSVSPNAEWFAFDGMAVELGLGLGEGLTATCEDVQSTGRIKVLQLCRQSMAQEKTKPQDRRPPFYTWNDFEYAITAGGKELKKGQRSDGILSLKGSRGALTAAVRHFWQNYDKAVEVDGQTLKLWLWPTEGRWPRYDPAARYNCRSVWFDGTLGTLIENPDYYLPGGVRKGHELILDFSGRDARQSAVELSAPLAALASAEYYASTEAAPGLFAPPEVRTGNKDCDAKLEAWTRMARSAADPASPTGLVKAHQQPCWHGWMDFGDLSVPHNGPVSLQYDWTWIMLASAMRTGDRRFLGLAVPMARHRSEVDQLWSDRETPDCRGLQRNSWNIPMFHCGRTWTPPNLGENWLAGVVLYYMLTGEPQARECALRNAQGLKDAWAWTKSQKRLYGRYDPRRDPGGLGWTLASYCAACDLTADKKWLDEAMTLFRTNVCETWKRFGPHLHDPENQIRGQDYQQEDMRYCYVIPSLCELHHRTGDETVFKLLKEGCTKPFPDSFFDAPLFLADLYAYVGWRENNPALLKKAADLFAQGFPESKCPPVFMPADRNWGRTSAMTLRTGHLLQYAHWKNQGKK